MSTPEAQPEIGKYSAGLYGRLDRDLVGATFDQKTKPLHKREKPLSDARADFEQATQDHYTGRVYGVRTEE